MIRTELYRERGDGVRLLRTYSDSGMMLRKDGTEELYSEAIDVEDCGYTYTETDTPVEEPDDELTLEDTLDMLRELGVELND